MKISFALTVLLILLCYAYSLYWNLPNGPRFSRAWSDIHLYHADGMPAKRTTDPWGNEYVEVQATADGMTVDYIISYGPDGKSETLGHDPDDITLWSGMYVWMESFFPVRPCIGIMLFFAGVASTLATLIIIRGRQQKSAQS